MLYLSNIVDKSAGSYLKVKLSVTKSMYVRARALCLLDRGKKRKNCLNVGAALSGSET